jgi:hypothetical protein
MSLSANLIPLMSWDKVHFWPKKEQIPDIIMMMTNLKITDVVTRINGKIYVDQKRIYDFLEDKKAKQLINYFKRMRET